MIEENAIPMRLEIRSRLIVGHIGFFRHLTRQLPHVRRELIFEQREKLLRALHLFRMDRFFLRPDLRQSRRIADVEYLLPVICHEIEIEREIMQLRDQHGRRIAIFRLFLQDMDLQIDECEVFRKRILRRMPDIFIHGIRLPGKGGRFHGFQILGVRMRVILMRGALHESRAHAGVRHDIGEASFRILNMTER